MKELKRLKELDSLEQTTADVFNISQSLVSKWSAKQSQLEEALKKGGPARKIISCMVEQRPGKYPLLEKQLYTDIRTKSGKGLRVTTALPLTDEAHIDIQVSVHVHVLLHIGKG